MMDELIEGGLIEVVPIEDFENSLKVLLRLARRQHQRVPENRYGLVAVRPPQFMPPGQVPG